MRHEFQKIRCQRCRAANPLGQELCDRCGTRLMLVVEPTSLRFEDDSAAEAPNPALLLERMTILEGGLTRFAEKLERGFDLMLKQAQNIHREHLLVESLIATLVQAGIVSRDDLEKLWRATLDREDAASRERERREAIRLRIITEAPASGKDAYIKLINDGFHQLGSGDLAGGIRTLERASPSTPRNFALQAFLAEQFFLADKPMLALEYLTRAHNTRRRDPRIALLFGLTFADLGQEVEIGRELIVEALKRGGKSFAGHYALGRLSALEGNWREASVEFRRALLARPCAASHFIFALASFKLSRLRLAERHARKSLALDENFGAAFFLLGLIHRREKEHARAREAFARAAILVGDIQTKGDGRKRASRETEQILLHGFFGSAQQSGRRLLTAGDQRLAQLMREDALAFNVTAR
ncbi:MAG: hypothetical protein QOF61_2678 [Acidobacteriota bacterium]|jgi:tetratricopeptide (TPR) repeat protein|nr:hypothetical protein [Acidobacteriota bacterium]